MLDIVDSALGLQIPLFQLWCLCNLVQHSPIAPWVLVSLEILHMFSLISEIHVFRPGPVTLL